MSVQISVALHCIALQALHCNFLYCILPFRAVLSCIVPNIVFSLKVAINCICPKSINDFSNNDKLKMKFL